MPGSTRRSPSSRRSPQLPVVAVIRDQGLEAVDVRSQPASRGSQARRASVRRSPRVPGVSCRITESRLPCRKGSGVVERRDARCAQQARDVPAAAADVSATASDSSRICVSCEVRVVGENGGGRRVRHGRSGSRGASKSNGGQAFPAADDGRGRGAAAVAAPWPELARQPDRHRRHRHLRGSAWLRTPSPAPVDRGGPRAPPPASITCARVRTWLSRGRNGASATALRPRPRRITQSGVSRFPGTTPARRPPDRLGGRAARRPLPSGTPSTRIRGAGRRTRGPRIRPGGAAPPPGGP